MFVYALAYRAIRDILEDLSQQRQQDAVLRVAQRTWEYQRGRGSISSADAIPAEEEEDQD
jgi:hypothetical protein